MLPKIKLVVDGRHYGGIEAHICQLYHQLIRRGYPCQVVLLSAYPESSFILQLKLQKVAFIELVGSWLNKVRQLKRMLGQGVLHSHGYRADLYCRLATLGSGRRSVTTFHNGDTGRGKLALYLWLDRITAPLSLNLAVSDAICQRIGPGCRHIRNWINQPGPAKTEFDRRFTLGFAGRLCRDKGFDRYIELARRLPHHRWVSFGDGELSPLLAQSNVHHQGRVDDLSSRLGSLDLLVIPSRAEGLPMVALEALGCGVPVVAFDVGDLRRLLAPEIGALVAAGDMEAMCAAIERLAGLPEDRRRVMAAAARRLVISDWSGDHSLELCQELYRRA